MRRASLPIAALLLFGGGFGIGWSVARRGMPASKQNVTPSRQKNKPSLQRMDGAAEALCRLGGFEDAFVYRWHGAILDGFVLLNTSQGTKRVAIDTEGMARLAFEDQQLNAAFRKMKTTEKLDSTNITGMFMLAIRPKVKGEDSQECVWSINLTVESEDKRTSAGLKGGRKTGRMVLTGRVSSAGGGTRAFAKHHTEEKEERYLFKIQLRVP